MAGQKLLCLYHLAALAAQVSGLHVVYIWLRQAAHGLGKGTLASPSILRPDRCCRGLRSGHQQDTIAKIKAHGCAVMVSTLDVVELQEAQQLMALAESKAPLAGIFQLAMMLDDRLIAQQVQHTMDPLHLRHLLRCTQSS